MNISLEKQRPLSLKEVPLDKALSLPPAVSVRTGIKRMRKRISQWLMIVRETSSVGWRTRRRVRFEAFVAKRIIRGIRLPCVRGMRSTLTLAPPVMGKVC